jgi:serine protease Do/serine protease DegQ
MKKTNLFSAFFLLLFATIYLGQIQAALPVFDSQDQPIPSLAPMLEKVIPAVVNISASSSSATSSRLEELLQDPIFRRFFDFDAPHHQPGNQSRALGSGVIVSAAKGYILTNNHVIEDTSGITVTLTDGRKIDAVLIGTDPQTDIAVLKVKAKNLTAVKMANSDKLRVGDFAVAIGHPFGLDQTVTSGIISGLRRNNLGIEGYEDFIQTDASINPGNSGGALVNLKGELIGINTAIFSRSGGNIGIGFAIPVNMAKSVMGQLVNNGSIERGILGVQIQDLTPELASALSVSVNKGAIVAQVIPNSAAEKAGIKTGDIIIKANNRKIQSSSGLRSYIGLKSPGDIVKLKLIRGNKKLTLTATIGGKKKLLIKTSNNNGFDAKQIHPALEGAVFGSTGTNNPGVTIIEIKPQSAAWHAGLRTDDTIVAINRHAVNSVDDIKHLSKPGKQQRSLALNIYRGNSALFIVLR